MSAEQFIKKASEFIHSVADVHLALRFRVCMMLPEIMR